MSSTIVPTLRYSDARAAIDWLCRAFGFQRRLVVEGEGGAIAHSQLVLGTGMVMVGPAYEGVLEPLVVPPERTAGVTTQSVYVIVQDVAAHFEHAVNSGAAVVMAPADQPYGGRLYTCRDLEGHVWHFGSYDPWSADGP